MKKKLLIVDGHNLLFQMFYGMPNKIYNFEGDVIHGVIGFIGALIKIISYNSPNYVLILFDSEQPLIRRIINEDYKRNRVNYSSANDEENPFVQLNKIYKVLDLMKIKYTEVKDVETDDMIASYCFKYQEKYNIVISSFDTDFYCLINDNIKIFRYRGKNSKLINKEFIEEKFSINPSSFIDYKALVGDTADNIKGISGIGSKTAVNLINLYGDIEGIIKHSNTIKNVRIKNKIIENEERLRENLKIIKFLKTDDLPFFIDELQYILPENIKTMDLLRKANITK